MKASLRRLTGLLRVSFVSVTANFAVRESGATEAVPSWPALRWLTVKAGGYSCRRRSNLPGRRLRFAGHPVKAPEITAAAIASSGAAACVPLAVRESHRKRVTAIRPRVVGRPKTPQACRLVCVKASYFMSSQTSRRERDVRPACLTTVALPTACPVSSVCIGRTFVRAGVEFRPSVVSRG